MSSILEVKSQIVTVINAALDGAVSVSVSDLVLPPKPELGDWSYPCFVAAKSLQRSPMEVAKEVAAKIVASGVVSAVEPAGPYVNFKLNQAEFSRLVMSEVTAKKETFGQAEAAKKERVIIEYASPNTHKELHVGHTRNFTLGLAVVNLTRANGYEVIPTCYIGDIGAHVAKCLWCLKKFHADELKSPPKDKGAWLGRIYAEATGRIEADEALKTEISEVLQKLEARDPEWHQLWQETREWSLSEFREIYDQLGMKLDRWYFESEVEQAGKEMAQDMLQRGIAEVGERGALIVNLENQKLGVALILKSDGTALYMTKELALAGLKFKEYAGVGRSVHIVDSRQSLYFKQFFAVLKLLGFDKELVHLGYEFVTLKEGAMSSRKGNIITYESVRDEAIERALNTVKEHHADWEEKRQREAAWIVAEGALKFAMLRQDPDKPIVFDLDAALAFDGFTGPYVQYAHARLSSILTKAGWEPTSSSEANIDDAGDRLVMPMVARFPEIVAVAADQYKPSILAQYLFELGQAANDYYRDVPVLGASKSERAHRLRVIEIVRQTLENGLRLLGITAPREM